MERSGLTQAGALSRRAFLLGSRSGGLFFLWSILCRSPHTHTRRSAPRARPPVCMKMYAYLKGDGPTKQPVSHSRTRSPRLASGSSAGHVGRLLQASPQPPQVHRARAPLGTGGGAAVANAGPSCARFRFGQHPLCRLRSFGRGPLFHRVTCGPRFEIGSMTPQFFCSHRSGLIDICSSTSPTHVWESEE